MLDCAFKRKRKLTEYEAQESKAADDTAKIH